MAKMLGPTSWYGKCVCWCCDPGTHNRQYRLVSKRVQRSRERREVRLMTEEDYR